MNKKMREVLTKINEKRTLAKAYMDGESKDVEKAGALLDEIDTLEKEYEVEKRLYSAEKEQGSPSDEEIEEKSKKKKVSGFFVLAKMVRKRRLEDSEKQMIVDGANGENNLLPEDVRLAINELRKTYISAKSLVTVESTDALTGSVNYEEESGTGLVDFSDGDDIDDSEAPKFAKKTYTIKFFGKLIPIGRILAGAEKAGLLGYINRWFVKNAILTENKAIFAKLKEGKSAKQIKGWKAFKKSINTDLDPSCLTDGVIVTNQTGFATLDEEEDANGRPILKENPADPTQKLFQGLPVHVFPDALLPQVGQKSPIFYGSLKAGCTFMDYQSLEFATSEHIFFGKNMNCLRVIEGFDVMGTDKDAYIYGTFEATPEPKPEPEA